MQVCTVVSGKTALIASGKPLQAVNHGDENVANASVSQLIHDSEPEFGALGGLDPQAQNVLRSIRSDAERNIDGLVTDQPLVADFDAQGVKKNQRIHRLERAVLPFGDRLQNRVGDR